MEDRQKLIKLIQYHIDHNREHAEELLELAEKFKSIGGDSAGIIVASELMNKSVEALERVVGSVK